MPQETYDKLLKRAGTKDDKGVASLAARVLGRFGDVPDSDRVIVVRNEGRKKLEELIQTTIEDEEQLVNLVRNLCKVKIGTVEYPLSPAQTIALTEQATFHGWNVDEYIKMTTDRVFNELLGLL
jgi:hypothetical protein